MRLSRRELVIATVTTATRGAPSIAEEKILPVDLFLFAGQSNMVGVTENPDRANVPPHLASSDPNTVIFNTSARALQTLTIGKNSNNDNDIGYWGPEAEFSYRWRQENPSVKFYLVKRAISGTYLMKRENERDWNPNSAGEHFDRFTADVRAAKTAIRARGGAPTVRAICWMQGESDALDAVGSAEYKNNLMNFFAKVRSDWGNKNTMIIVGRVTSIYNFAPVIRAAQAGVVAIDIAAGNRSALIDTDSYPRDSLHYTTVGQVMLGAAMYNAYAHSRAGIRIPYILR